MSVSVNSPTLQDLLDAQKYAYHQYMLRFIPRWRRRFPHILINYTIRPAGNEDFYVPRKIRDSAVFVDIKFSKRGCESMSCYPFRETGPISRNTPFGYTQTADTPQAYAQPACYHLDRSAAMREGEEDTVQSVELRYTENERCIMMDTYSKMYLNSPYLRTDEHLIKGIDDVPGFNVEYGSDPHFPEKFKGSFNAAYCRRFGREMMNGTCLVRWWESMIGFVLGDTIYITLKLLVNNVFSELRNFDYRRPSEMLPTPPQVDSARVLDEWRNVRDPTVDVDFENKFSTFKSISELDITQNVRLVYKAETGYTREQLPASKFASAYRIGIANCGVRIDRKSRDDSDAELDAIIAQFLEDHALLFGIFTDMGFEALLSNFKSMLKKINTTLLPKLRSILLSTTSRVSARFLSYVYKGAVINMMSRLAIKTVTALAKALARMAIMASSVIGIVLIAMTLVDLLLMFWDPFGYNNMFPREFPDDLVDSFLISYYESIGEGSRDMIEFEPIFFGDMVEDMDEYQLDSILFIWEYLDSLEVNSDGQLLLWEEDEPVSDFDDITLVGAALASSAMYTRAEFYAYTERHNRIMTNSERNRTPLGDHILTFLLLACAGIAWIAGGPVMSSLVIIFILMIVFKLINAPFMYFIGMQRFAAGDPLLWYINY
uniref:p74 n=1 Tax=Spodoptera litura multicapsid nucleopolyhedrovirus TaxID=46242 RepID=D5K697_NPVST|nr:P74 [Spodoptera litura nucleopolyhedrovirus]